MELRRVVILCCVGTCLFSMTVGGSFVFQFMSMYRDVGIMYQTQKQFCENAEEQIVFLKNEFAKCQKLVRLFSRTGKMVPLGDFIVTAYDSGSCAPFSGKVTSVLIPVGVGVAAVDPTTIPYGTVLFVPALRSYFFAYDTGADMRKYGRHIDLFLDEGAKEFGRQFLEVWAVDLF